MDIDLPKYHNLKNCPNLRETGHYFRIWEISVQNEDSLEWSVVLSHLTSANLRNDTDFARRIIDLVNGEEENTLEIKDCISSFNPFLNRYSCFYNKSLQKLVNVFKEKLRKAEMHDGAGSHDFKLEAASSFLNSQIIVITAYETGDIEIKDIFPKHGIISNDSPRMTLYYCKLNNQDKYNFGLKKERGNQLKTAAFNKILKEANIKKGRRRALSSLDKGGENFVTSVLKSEYKSSIPLLYKSSYLAWKLAEAGYEMDPRVIDSNGFSVLYHALKAEDKALVYVLHNYAANACHETDKTFRDPDEFILNNLLKLGEIMEGDKEKSNDFQVLDEKAHTVRHRAKQLIYFNNFLTQICQNILEEQKKCDNIFPQNISEAISRKNVVLALLETYDSFFFFDKDKTSSNCFLKLEDYCEYNTYYRNLDYSATLFFFDNIFSLKERLKLKDNEYSELESNFFLSVLSNKYFSSELFKSNFSVYQNSQYQKMFDEYRTSILRSSQKRNDLKFIPLIERMCLRKKMKNFIKILSEVRINDNIVPRLPQDEIPKTLASLPEVKDELEIHRLRYYLETAMKQNVEGPKQVLVIERALQVLGEFIVNGRNNPRSLCFLLTVCLPEETFRTIKQTRNILSHLNEYTFAPKFKAEKNTSLFRDIQKDIGKIYGIFKSVFDIQQLRLAEFLFRRGLQEIERRISSLEGISKNASELLLRLQDEYNMLCEIKSKPCYNSTIFKNLNVLTNIRLITREKMKTILKEYSFENIEDILWPLKYLLTLIAKDCKDLNVSDVQTIIRFSEDVLSCASHDVREKLEEFWENYEQHIVEPCIRAHSDKFRDENIGCNIEKFKKMLKGFTYFSEAVKEEIRSKIPQSVKDSIKLKQEIQKSFESREPLTGEQIMQFNTLFLSKRNLRTLKKNFETDFDKALEAIRTASDPTEELNVILDQSSMTMDKDAFKQLCDRLQFSEDVIKKLGELDIGKKQTVLDNDLYNILNRIKLLRYILIEESSNISELWYKAKGVKTQKFAKYKIVQRYVRDSNVQASVEMLLFDCMILLGNVSDIELLWIKASSLFSGINLRNVLGHGNPTLETVGKLLDPDDLPSVLVEEMLQLIKDEVVIQAMYDLCVQTDSDFDMFQNIMNDEEDEIHAEARNLILKCERWKRYSKLIRRNKRINVLSNISHSSSIDSEECESSFEVE